MNANNGSSPKEDVASEMYLAKLAILMEEQLSVLRRMDERQSTRDLSKQPMPEVPATSSSAWNALLRSALTDTIQPKVDQWRSGLDALLVFLGLFSAIVTSFFVDSLSTLQQDHTVRTNELGFPPEDLHVSQPVVFHPNSTDVRLNSLWSLALILSLSIAALAVACRGFLNMVAWSRFTKASEKLIDIRTRWAASERFLGPTIQLLPQLLVVPVLLFIAGLLDTLFSSVLQLSPAPMPILFTSGVSLFLISGVAALLCYTLAQGSLNPSGSPFHRLSNRSRDFPATLSTKAPSIYHEVVQGTHDDDTLNQASAALYNIMQSLAVWPRYGGPNPGLLDQERRTFLHLLSPEASTRSNRTAVQVISRIQESNRIRYSLTDMSELVPALLQAAKRSPESIVDLWDSPFIRAMAIIANAGTISNQYPPALAFLSSEYVDNQHLPSDSDPSAEYGIRTRTIHPSSSESLAELPRSASEDELVTRVLSSPSEIDAKTPTSLVMTPTPTPPFTNSTINPGKIIAALIHLPRPQNELVLTLIIRWLVRTTSPLGVIRAAQTHIGAIGYPDVWPTVLFFIASITGRVCLAADSFHEHAALAELCVDALVKIAHFHQFHPRLPALVGTAVAALREIGSGKVAPQMAHDLLAVRKFIEDDTWRWSSKQRLAVLAQLESLESAPSSEAPGTEGLKENEFDARSISVSSSPASTVDRGAEAQLSGPSSDVTGVECPKNNIPDVISTSASSSSCTVDRGVDAQSSEQVSEATGMEPPADEEPDVIAISVSSSSCIEDRGV
ncbi:hypothetical protein FB451DRAFT_1231411 [Mycena latifolia]|nr:hypothetical protein FB451DRAFT_1231411 [Mycena latifolia]